MMPDRWKPTIIHEFELSEEGLISKHYISMNISYTTDL